MKAFFWKLQYAINIRRRAELPWLMAWECASTSWEDWKDMPLSPEDAVTEELSCWTE